MTVTTTPNDLVDKFYRAALDARIMLKTRGAVTCMSLDLVIEIYEKGNATHYSWGPEGKESCGEAVGRYSSYTSTITKVTCTHCKARVIELLGGKS